MTGGSTEKEDVHDEQCSECGLWYSGKGNALNMHEASCDGSTDSGTSDDSTGSDGSDSTESGSSSGSGMSTPGSGQDDTDGSDDSDGGGNVPDCPQCDEPLAEESKLKQMTQDDGGFRCSDCGARLTWT